MRARGAFAGGVAGLALAAAVAGCGGSGPHTPNLKKVPMVSGSRTVFQTMACDPGANAYCGIDLVVYNRAYRNSQEFLTAERNELHAHGWTDANGDVGPETAADSPGHKIHLTYASANGELDAIDYGWVKRPRSMTLALSNSIFVNTAALALEVEIDSGAT
jgi:hypothetical protein